MSAKVVLRIRRNLGTTVKRLYIDGGINLGRNMQYMVFKQSTFLIYEEERNKEKNLGENL